MAKPLENVKILDLTRVLAGPYCTMLLNDMGAEVIKVEIPTGGDDSRSFGPFINNKSLYFISVNRGKKSISINLKAEKGKNIIKELVKKVDVIIENFTPGTMEKLGLGYETIKQINPKIIYAASSGFGHTGPYSNRPAYDMLVQAMGGIMSITGWENTPPTRVGMSIGDITASFFTAIGILSALYQRTITNEGQKVDVAMLDCQLGILENAILRYQSDKVSPKPIGNRHPTITPFQAYKAKDKYFVIAVGNDAIWAKFCKAIERADLIDDELYKNNKLRTLNIEKLNNILNDIIITKTAEEWVSILDKNAVPCSFINSIGDIINHEQVIARNMIVEVEDKDLGKIKIAGNPIKMTNIEDKTTKEHAPEIGENNFEILNSMLGLSEEEINQLKSEGVL